MNAAYTKTPSVFLGDPLNGREKNTLSGSFED